MQGFVECSQCASAKLAGRQAAGEGGVDLGHAVHGGGRPPRAERQGPVEEGAGADLHRVVHLPDNEPVHVPEPR